MGVAEQSALIVTIRLNDQMTAGATKVGKSVSDLERKTVSLRRATARLNEGLRTGLANSAKIAAVGVGILAYNIKQGIDELVQWEDAQLQINAVLKSTNQVAGVTAAQTEKLALKYADLTNYEDDVVLSAEAILLRFPNIKKKAFEPTLKAATDLAAGMGRDLPTAARSLAMAMNNPTAGLLRLKRAGLDFTDQQKEQVKRLVESGKLQKAQGIILAQVSKIYGGSAQKATEGYRGSMIKLDKAVKDLQQSLAEPLIGPLTKLARRLAEFAKSPEIKQGLTDLGNAIAGLFSNENLDAGFKTVKDGFTFMQNLDWAAIRSGVDSAAAILGAAIKTFTSLPAPIQGALVSFLAINKLTGGLGTAAVKGLAELMVTGLKTITAVNVTVIGANVTGPGVTPVVTGGGGGFFTTLLSGIASAPGVALGLGATFAAVIGDQIVTPLVRSLMPAYDRQYKQLFGDKTAADRLNEIIAGLTGGGKDPTQGRRLSTYYNPATGRPRRVGRPTGADYVTSDASGWLRGFPGFTAPPGGPGAMGQQPKVRWADESIRALREGTIRAEDWRKINAQLERGNITYRQAVSALHNVERNTRSTTQAIQGQKYQFTLKPSVTISAAATQNAIVFAANGQRLIIS